MPSRPNVLLITTDQQRWDTIAALGAPGMWTPHLDWLVDTGISFTDAMTDCPLCGPSRATIMTGQHAWRHGELENRSDPSPMRDRLTMPGLLTQAGYQTRGVGKMHFNPIRAHYGFEHLEILPDYYRWVARQPGVRTPKRHGIGENEMAPCLATTDDDHTVTAWIADRSIDFLETRDDTRPFFLWTSFSKPHPPFDAPRSCWEMIDADALRLPLEGDWSDHMGSEIDAWREPTYHLNNCHRFSPSQLRQVHRAYAACILHVDQQIGRVLNRIRELSLMQNTWIVFASDHGEMMGDHRMGAKTVFFQGSRRVPLVVRPPSAPWLADARAGNTDDRLACLADLFPTVAALTGTPIPDSTTLDGQDLLATSTRDRIYGECEGYHAIISKEWSYHFTERGDSELLFRRGLEEERHELSERFPDQRAALYEDLRTHWARQNHRLTSQPARYPLLSEQEARRRVWPGFHSIDDENCDLLH